MLDATQLHLMAKELIGRCQELETLGDIYGNLKAVADSKLAATTLAEKLAEIAADG